MPRISTRIRQATLEDHSKICKIAKQSKYTSAYSNMIFSGEDCYAAGRIRVAVRGDQIVGFTCVRNRVRGPATVLYFIGVDSQLRSQGIGALLMTDMETAALTHVGIVEFKVMKDNRACEFYRRLNYVEAGEAFDGQAWVMRKSLVQ